MIENNDILSQIPGLNCGSCGFKTCSEFSKIVEENPEMLKRCIHLNASAFKNQQITNSEVQYDFCNSCTSCSQDSNERSSWKDSLDREFDFILDLFPNEPGPKETIRLHNPMLTRELDIQKGDVLIGRPMGMSCGCPITHCGVAIDVDKRTGIIVWCITGPLNPRQKGFKDLGYYSAEAYEGIVKESQVEIKVGMRYWFMPQRCMLQWRHSGLVNFVNRTPKGIQIRLEGLFIG